MLLFKQGLIPRAKLLLTIGGTFFIGFWPLILVTVASFSALYLVRLLFFLPLDSRTFPSYVALSFDPTNTWMIVGQWTETWSLCWFLWLLFPFSFDNESHLLSFVSLDRSICVSHLLLWWFVFGVLLQGSVVFSLQMFKVNLHFLWHLNISSASYMRHNHQPKYNFSFFWLSNGFTRIQQYCSCPEPWSGSLTFYLGWIRSKYITCFFLA